MSNTHEIWNQVGIKFTIPGSALGFSSSYGTRSGELNMWLDKTSLKRDWYWEKQEGQEALKLSSEFCFQAHNSLELATFTDDTCDGHFWPQGNNFYKQINDLVDDATILIP